jgi:hypothetical protein
MVIDEDGRRVGRFESEDPGWRAGDAFTLEERMWRILEVLPEVSTMVAYNAVWIAAPAADEDDRAATQREISSATGSGQPVFRSASTACQSIASSTARIAS